MDMAQTPCRTQPAISTWQFSPRLGQLTYSASLRGLGSLLPNNLDCRTARTASASQGLHDDAELEPEPLQARDARGLLHRRQPHADCSKFPWRLKRLLSHLVDRAHVRGACWRGSIGHREKLIESITVDACL